jgi:hypothetical protein
VEIDLSKANSDFYIMSLEEDKKYHFELQDLELKIPITILSDAVYERMQSQRLQKTIMYNITTKHVQDFPISKGQSSFNTTAPWPNNTAPTRVIIGFVRERSYNGTQTTNPFNFLRRFGMCYIEHLSLSLNQKPMGALEGDQTKNDCLIDYYRMNHFLAFTDSPFSNSISYDEFCGGAFLKVYDLSTSGSSNEPFVQSVTRNGQYKLVLKFSTPLPFEIVCLLFCDYSGTIAYSKHNKISLSYVT